MIVFIKSLVQVFNIVSKLSTFGIFSKFFNKNPKTGASAGVTVTLTIITNLFGYIGWGITPDQAMEITEGILAVGALFAAHFVPSPMKKG